MNDELFPIEAITADSPRLAWMKRLAIVTHHSLPNDPESHRWYAGFWDWAEDFDEMDGMEQSADSIEVLFFYEYGANGNQNTGEGSTEDEAIVDLCIKHNLPLWNEAKP